MDTQNAPTGYVGLFSRLSGFARTDLTDALTGGRVVQAWAMRSTMASCPKEPRENFAE